MTYHSELDRLLQDMDLVIATTARERGAKRRYLPPAALAQRLASMDEGVARVALLFGCEASGLPNRVLQQAQLWSYIPLAVDYPSLNLAQAVMVYAYALSGLARPRQAPQPRAQGEREALRGRVEALLRGIDAEDDHKLSEWLFDTLALAGDRDVRMLHTLLSDLQRALASRAIEVNH